MMRCQYCHSLIEHYIWHVTLDEVRERLECVIHGELSTVNLVPVGRNKP